jgi:hypothetical protein
MAVEVYVRQIDIDPTKQRIQDALASQQWEMPKFPMVVGYHLVGPLVNLFSHCSALFCR